MKTRNAHCGLMLGLRSLAAGIISASRHRCLLVCALYCVPLAPLHAVVPTYQLLKSLDSTTGTNPYARLIQGTDGALYGTTYSQGGLGYGTVFKLNPDGTGFSVLKNFDSSTTGGNPSAGLIQGADGVLYGTATYGGSSGHGTVFKLNPDGSGFAVLKNFDSSTIGRYLYGGVMQGADGALYGTASYGGSSGYGTVFKLNPDGTGFTLLQNFDSFTTGGNLQAGLIQGTDGALYGTASEGGSSGYGTAFKLNPDGSGFTVLKNFDSSATGRYPSAELMQGADGALYGAAVQGGSSGYGTVFKLNPDGSGFTVLQNFDYYTTGGYPGKLTQGADGALYGTARSGGSTENGTVFKLNPDGTGFTVLLIFDSSTTGGFPYASLTQGADGALYGAAAYGGDEDAGTVFRLVFNSPTTAVLWPPNHGLVAVAITGVTDLDNNATITITGVTQDEPTSGLGDGDTAIDAIINGDGTVLLRAERAGKGDGRVYRIAFTASDPEGSVSGVVFVKVPNTLKKPAIDSGGVFDSTL